MHVILPVKFQLPLSDFNHNRYVDKVQWNSPKLHDSSCAVYSSYIRTDKTRRCKMRFLWNFSLGTRQTPLQRQTNYSATATTTTTVFILLSKQKYLWILFTAGLIRADSQHMWLNLLPTCHMFCCFKGKMWKMCWTETTIHIVPLAAQFRQINHKFKLFS